MKSNFIAAIVGLVLSIPALPAAAEITFFITTPDPEKPYGDTLPIGVAVTSQYEIAEMKAKVFGQEIALDWVEGGYFEGVADVTGIGWGKHPLTITAKDVFGGSASETVEFLHDLPPTVVVYEPANYSVARPSIHVHITCSDDGPKECLAGVTWTVKGPQYKMLKTITGHEIDTDISFADFEGTEQLMVLFSGDEFQVSAHDINVLVDSSPFLVEVDSVPAGKIVDFDEKRILFNQRNYEEHVGLTPGPGLPQKPVTKISIYDRTTGEVKVLGEGECFIPLLGSESNCVLTPYGAVFAPGWGSDNPLDLLEYREGIPDYAIVEKGFGLATVQSAGKYVIWDQVAWLYLYDTESQVKTLVAKGAGGTYCDVAANGDVVFWATDYPGGFYPGGLEKYEEFRYRDGKIEQLTESGDLWSLYVTTDGINVVFKRCQPCCGPDSCAIYAFLESGEEILLSPETNWDWGPYPYAHYRANNGWIAFVKFGPSGIGQCWVRSPSGEQKQLSFFGSKQCSIDNLGPNGDIMFRDGAMVDPGSKYYASPDSPAQLITPNLGQSRRDGDTWYVVMGRTLFKVVDQSAPCAPGDACDDGNPCTEDDQCDIGGVCMGKPVEGCPSIEPGPESPAESSTAEEEDHPEFIEEQDDLVEPQQDAVVEDPGEESLEVPQGETSNAEDTSTDDAGTTPNWDQSEIMENPVEQQVTKGDDSVQDGDIHAPRSGGCSVTSGAKVGYRLELALAPLLMAVWLAGILIPGSRQGGRRSRVSGATKGSREET